MATKDRRKLQHIHSSIADKQPTPQSLEVGEIAVNNSAKKEFLSIKNSDDKVVRFSSDSTIIDWIEKKEVMPYSGVVDNVHLDTNRSNIEIKINQVAAKNTPKYDKINGAVDIDGQLVNPSTDGGKTDGAGIAIDMSRYAMIGANPSFSSITVTDKSDLSGNTTIANGDGTSTRTGHTLAIKTTDVTANDTNWTETITNRTSTVTNETDKITTLNESATTRTTVVGTENLTVSGTTTEVHTGNVNITNSANKQENTTGTHSLYSTGNTCINSQANANFYGKVNTNIGVACDGTTKGSATTVVGTTTLNMSGATTTISGNTTNVTGATTLNLSGNTTNKRALTANTTSTSAYTSATTATTVIGTANTSATTATLSGNTLDITEATRLSAKTPSTYVSGTSLSVVEANTDIESCGRISGNTNAFTIQECATGSGKTVINQTDIKASGKTLSFDETTSISAKTPTTTLSGTNLNINETTSTINSTNTNLTGTNLTISESNTSISSCTKLDIVSDDLSFGSCTTAGTIDFNFCNGFGVNSNNIKLHQCASAGTISISAQTQNINGGNLTIRESGATDFSGNTLTATTASNANINVKGNLTEVVTGTTNETHSGAVTINNSNTKTENTTGVLTENNANNHIVNTTGTTTIKSTGSTNIETNGNNNKVTIQASGTGGDVEVFAKDTLCASGGTTAAFVGSSTTNIGSNCSGGGNTAALNVRGVATNISAGTITQTTSGATTINVGGNLTENVTGTTNETHNGAVSITNGAAKNETTTGAVTENNKGGFSSYTSGNTCIQSNATINLGGDTDTNIGTNCAGAVYSNNVNIKATGGIVETASTVTISGTTSVSMSGATANVSGGTTNINGATNLNLIGGSITESSTSSVCITGGTTAAFVGTTKTNIGKNCSDGGQTTTLNINGNTINETGATVNVTSSSKTCIQAGTDLNIGGDATTNVGTNCAGGVYSNNVNIYAQTAITETANTVNISGTSTVNVSGATVNVSGGSINETSTGKTCITAGGDLNIGGDANTNVGYNCAGTGIANNTNVFASSVVTINAPKTNITGDTYLSGKTYFHKTCTGLTNNEIDAAFCEILNRGAITIEKNTSPTDPQLATVYTVKQNGAVINTIEVAKDQFLSSAEVVKNTAGEWVIRLTWWIYDPDSGTHTTTTTDIEAKELVKDLTAVNPSDNGTALNHNVSVNAWYDSTSGDMKFSAETTPNMHVGNMYVTGTTSAATVSGTTVKGATVSAGTLTATGNTTLAATTASSVSATSVSSPTINGTNITASAAMRANNVSANTISANTFTGAMSKKLTWTAGAFTADTAGYNGSSDKVINVPTAISHLATRGKLTVTHNGLIDTYDPASDKSMTLPHSALTINFGVATGQTNTSYNTSAGRTITIPTSTAHLSKATLTIDYNADVRSKSDTSYNTEAAATVSIPGSLDHLSNYDGTNININHPTKINGNVSVTGTITASGAIYSSDRNLKENIFDISENEFERIGFVKYKTYNFKGEDNKMYGVIAQDLQDAGLGEMVYSRDDGTLAVDYTSLMILQLARLKRDNENMLNHIAWLERRIEELEGGNKE